MKQNRILPALFCVLLMLSMLSFSLVYSLEENLSSVEPTAESYHVTYSKGTRNSHIADCDATTKYIYFAYTENISVVDAYNMNGDYSFSIHFAPSKKGSISIRSYNDLLYISTKAGSVFIFDGDECIRLIAEQAAIEYGYTWKWFDEASLAKIEGIFAYRLDDQGNTLVQIPVPFGVIWGYYSRYFPIAAIIFVICLELVRSKRKPSINKRLPN